jgi:hypothetical protein
MYPSGMRNNSLEVSPLNPRWRRCARHLTALEARNPYPLRGDMRASYTVFILLAPLEAISLVLESGLISTWFVEVRFTSSGLLIEVGRKNTVTSPIFGLSRLRYMRQLCHGGLQMAISGIRMNLEMHRLAAGHGSEPAGPRPEFEVWETKVYNINVIA